MALKPLGIEMRRTHDFANHEQFLPFQQTISDASKAGISVGDYIDITYNTQGATQETIDRLDQLGVFSDVRAVAEIGPGSGRYLEKVIRKCSPDRYEIYETARPWARYLKEQHHVILHPTDGYSMRSTDTSSVDLAQAHKVFVATPFLTTCHYWEEMIRVVRPGGHVVFDILTEQCLDPSTLRLWLDKAATRSGYPCIMPRHFALGFFSDRGIQLIDSFSIPMRPGRTEVFVFMKKQSQGPVSMDVGAE
jgi:hypothetical protein